MAIEEGLNEPHFYLPSHATLYGVLLSDFGAGKEIELVSLVQRLLDRGLLERVGGAAELSGIMTYAPSPGHFRHHIATLKEKYAAREMIRVSNTTITAVFDDPEGVPQTLEEMEREVMRIRDINTAEKPQTVRQVVNLVIDHLKAEMAHEPTAKGVQTGFAEFDRMTTGLCPAEVTVIAARPSVGKTALMMNIVEHACIQCGIPTLVFSAEMSSFRLTQRLIFGRARYSLASLNRGSVPCKGDLIRIQRASVEVADSGLIIDDKSSPSISYIAAAARRKKREHGIGLIAIDYLQLLKATSKQAEGSRERESAEVSAGVKAMAKDLNVPVVLLAQLNRGIDARKGDNGKPATPRLSDLRESGSIEQDADCVAFLTRTNYQDPENADASAFLHLAKNRNGETGIVPLTFLADLMRFESGRPYQEPTESRY